MSNALKAIHVGFKQLGYDEDMRRGLYEQVTGKRSATDMDEREREQVVSRLRDLGFKKSTARRPSGRLKLTGEYAGKLQALWIGAWNLGLVENNDDAALVAFVKRQTGLDHVRFLKHAGDATKAIEALKSWMARDGGVNWRIGEYDPLYKCAGFRIAWAQWFLLGPDAMPVMRRAQFGASVHEITGRSYDKMQKDSDWIPVMNELGERIRAKKATA